MSSTATTTSWPRSSRPAQSPAHGPNAAEKIAEQNRALKEENAALKTDMAAERERNKTLTRVAVELSLELEQAKEELTQNADVVRLPGSRTNSPSWQR